jgi:hypothetical protein
VLKSFKIVRTKTIEEGKHNNNAASRRGGKKTYIREREREKATKTKGTSTVWMYV